MRVVRFILAHSLPYRPYMGGMIVAICLVSMVETTLPFIIKQLIDTATAHASHNIVMLFCWFGLLNFIRCAAWALSDYCTAPLMSHFRLDIASVLIEKLYHYPYTFFQNRLSGTLGTKLNDATLFIPVLTEKAILDFIYIVLIVTVAAGILWMVQPLLSLIMMLWTIVFLSINFFCRKKIMRLVKEYAEERSKFLGLIADYLMNIFNVKTFVTKNFELNRFQEKKKPLITATYKKYYYMMNFYIVQGMLASTYSLGSIILLVSSYQKGLITPGVFALAVTTNFHVINQLFQFSHTLRDFLENYGAVDQALTLFDELPDIQDKPDATLLQVTHGKISFEHICFGYKNRLPLFQQMSLTIEPGQKVGLVGYSGGGKSTLINLLLRFYDIQQGRITIDGQNIQDVTQDSLRQQIGLIPQNSSLFHRTIGDNIGYGRTDATQADIRHAAHRAGAHQFINKLPERYDALVGERGIKLSGGQIQRIAIARVFLKNPPILILDEATSQLDSLTESDIQEHLWELMQNKTVIVIAHRLSTLLRMDRIVVIDKGQIVEEGRHEQLLAKGGLYKTLWDAQAGGFLPDKRR